MPRKRPKSYAYEQERRRKARRYQADLAQSAGETNQAENSSSADLIVDEHYCGKLNVLCTSCGAYHFIDEKPQDGKFTNCCHKGKVQLQPFKPPPPLLMDLLTGNHPLSKNFQENIRNFNSAFGFASMGAKVTSPPGFGPYCFRIHGQIYHRTGTLHPPGEQERSYAQIYILDQDEALQVRMNKPENSECSTDLMRLLGEMMTQNSPFAQAYQMLHEVEKQALAKAEQEGIQLPQISMMIKHDRNKDPRRYNTQTCNEVAFVFKNVDGEPPLERDLQVYLRPTADEDNTASSVKRISVLDPNLEPMVYPMFFPFGDQGWSTELKLTGSAKRERITQMQYYGHRFAIREGFNILLNGGKLTQQFFVDAYIKTEANRLNFIRLNQSKLRVDLYSGLLDHINSDAGSTNLPPGKPVVLPSSFQGSPRNMQQNYQDAMAIVRKFGKPDLFVTMTCNPQWKEITENLEKWQKVEHRPDLVVRVFHVKLQALLKDICKNHLLGKVKAKIHVIEFQKRGLPHAHILIILEENDKPRTEELIDFLVNAEIPENDEKLQDLVLKHMIHGPCGSANLSSPCMSDGTCTKDFPKEFRMETKQNIDGYPMYRRRQNVRCFVVRKKPVDNRWVVPYNPTLLKKYNCHINVEICASVKSVKYLFKYVYKGHDCANIELEEHTENNEIKRYMDSRYVSAPEAAWRLFGYRMHEQTHAIIRLQVHLPMEQSVVFHPDGIKRAVENADRKNTTLTAWFLLNQSDSTAKTLLYHQIPEHYVFNNNSWTKRKKGGKKVIGRMYSVSIADSERYFLRILLLHVRGAESFEDIMLYNSVQHSTFKDAAKARGLLAHDDQWEATLEDAAFVRMPKQMRQLFALICVYGCPSDVLSLYTKFYVSLSEDFSHRHNKCTDCSMCEDEVLRDIAETLAANGRRLSDYSLRIPPVRPDYILDTLFNPEEEKSSAFLKISTFNEDQKNAFDSVVQAVESKAINGNCFFLDGPAGSGKTYLYSALLSYFRGKKQTVLPVASTGIAANLLSGGRTYFSQYKLPVPLLENSTSNLKLNSNDAKTIQRAALLIWDEVTMATCHALNAVDRLLKDLMDSPLPFGGKILLLGGDFRQCLPVVPHASRASIVQTSIKYSHLWSFFKTLRLSSNIRSTNTEYSDWLLKLGEGILPQKEQLPEDMIEVPHHAVCTGSIVKEIFGAGMDKATAEESSQKAILSTKNDSVDEVNQEVLDLLTGVSITYYSSDSMEDPTCDDPTNYPMEFLNTLTPSGMPRHELILKEGSIGMLLRNLNTKRGLCNGTRLIINEMKPNLLLCKVLTGSAAGNIVFVPRVDLAPVNPDLPFVLRRRQFPLKLAFAMTINKAQGQTLKKVGIYLKDSAFSHGQLYVAFSRVRTWDDVRVKVIESQTQGQIIPESDAVFTRNLVFKEIF